MKISRTLLAAAACLGILVAGATACSKEPQGGGKEQGGQDKPESQQVGPGEYLVPLPEKDLIPNPASIDDLKQPKPDDTINPNFQLLENYVLEAIDTSARTATVKYTGTLPEIKDGITILNLVNQDRTQAYIIKPYAHTVDGGRLKISSWVNVPLNELLYNQTIYVTADENDGNYFEGSETGSKQVVRYCQATKADDKKVTVASNDKLSKWDVDITTKLNIDNNADIVLKFNDPKVDPNSIRAISQIEKAGVYFKSKARLDLTASVTFSRAQSKAWDTEIKRDLIVKTFLVPAGPVFIPIGVGADIRGRLELGGELSGTVAITVPASLDAMMGVEYNKDHGLTPVKDFSMGFEPENPSIDVSSEGSVWVKGSVYPRLKVCPGIILQLYVDPMPFLKPTVSVALKKVFFPSFDLMAGADFRAGVAVFDPLDRGRAPYKTILETDIYTPFEKSIWSLPGKHEIEPEQQSRMPVYMMPNDPVDITYDYFEYNAATGEYVRSKNFMPYEFETQVNMAGGKVENVKDGTKAGGSGYVSNYMDQSKADYDGRGKSQFVLKSTAEDVLLITRTLNSNLKEHQADTIVPVRRIKSFRAVYTYTGGDCIKSRTYVKDGKYIRDDYINKGGKYGTNIYDMSTGKTWMWQYDPSQSPSIKNETVAANGCAHYIAIDGYEQVIDRFEQLYLDMEAVGRASLLPAITREWILDHYCKTMAQSGTTYSWWMNIPFKITSSGSTQTLTEFEIYKKPGDCSDDIFRHNPAGGSW